MTLIQAGVLSAALLASACGGGGSGDSGGALCTYFSGTATTAFTVACGNCTQSSGGASIDSDTDSFAELAFGGGGTGRLALRATAQTGIVYPRGSRVGVVSARNFGLSSSPMLTLTTYLGGISQEEFNLLGSTNGVASGDGAKAVQQFTTAADFDAVEFAFFRSAGAQSADFQVYEFCTN